MKPRIIRVYVHAPAKDEPAHQTGTLIVDDPEWNELSRWRNLLFKHTKAWVIDPSVALEKKNPDGTPYWVLMEEINASRVKPHFNKGWYGEEVGDDGEPVGILT